jgi:cytochrome c6
MPLPASHRSPFSGEIHDRRSSPSSVPCSAAACLADHPEIFKEVPIDMSDLSVRGGALFVFCLAASFLVPPVPMSSASEKKGEALFKQHCVACHPDGGNIVNPKKTLRKADLHKNGIKSKNDIIRTMRNPGPGMLKFDKATVSDHDAEEIAEFILKTYAK